MADSWVTPTRTRPTTYPMTPDDWDELRIRKTPNWSEQVEAKKEAKPTQPSQWTCNSVCLSSTANGTGTYRAELWRGGKFITHFYIGIYPHPGSLSWGDVEGRPDEHRRFLYNLANGIATMDHVIKINADDLD